MTKGVSIGRAATCFFSALLIAFSAGAAAAAETSDPQRVEERLPDQPKSDTPTAPVRVDGENLAAIPEFTLKWVAFEGVTAIGKAKAETCAAPLIGQKVGAADLIGLTECVTKLYRDEGYFLSRAIVPPQEVQGGALKLHVIEGYIASVEPSGLSQTDADAQFASTYAEHPARIKTFERSMLLLSDRYGYRVTSSRLASDPNDPARFTFKLAVEMVPVTWRVFGDNRGDARQGPEQGLLSVAWNSPFGASDRIMGQLFSAPADAGELIFADLSYGRSWFDGMFSTEFGVSASRSSAGGPLPEFTSESDRIYGRMTIPVLRARRNSLWAKLQLDARNAEVTDLEEPRTSEKTRVLRGSFAYTLVDGKTRADITLEASQGLDALGASQNGEAHLSRSDSRPQFTKVRLDAALSQRLFDALDLVATGTGQWADGALPSSEEFGAGGARVGRAYDYSEIVGDRALAGALELRWTWTKLTDWLTKVQIYGFADAARVWNAGGRPSDIADASLTSAGGGVRVSVAPGLNATVEVAKPLTRDVGSQGDRTPRVFVSLAAGW